MLKIVERKTNIIQMTKMPLKIGGKRINEWKKIDCLKYDNSKWRIL